MSIKYANHFQTTITDAGGITATQITMTLLSVAGLPALGAGDWFRLVLLKLATNQRECVKVTGVSGKTITMQRAQEDTVGLAFAQYDAVELWITKGVLDDVIAERDTEAFNAAQDALALATSSTADAAEAHTIADSAIAAAIAAQADADAAQATADAALPAAGGTVTGTLILSGDVQFTGTVVGTPDSSRVGDIIMRISPTPSGRMLLCNGASYSALDEPGKYSGLFAHLKELDDSGIFGDIRFVISETLQTFRVPDLQGVVPIGVGTNIDSRSTQKTIEPNKEIRAYLHALSSSENGSHNHTIGILGTTGNNSFGLPSSGNVWGYITSSGTSSSGSGNAHNNIQPSYGLYFFITY